MATVKTLEQLLVYMLQRHVAVVFPIAMAGIGLFILILLRISFPTSDYLVYKAHVAILGASVASLAAAIPGGFKAKLSATGYSISLGGALGVGIAFCLWNPVTTTVATLSNYNPVTSPSPGASVHLPAVVQGPASNPPTSPSSATPQCQLGVFADGECLPPRGSTNIAPQLSWKLYLRCTQRGGSDEYTTRCCDHLPVSVAAANGVCGFN